MNTLKSLCVVFLMGLLFTGCNPSQGVPYVATFYVDAPEKTFVKAKLDGRLVYGKETEPKDLPLEVEVEVTHGDSLSLYTAIDSGAQAKTEISINGDPVKATEIGVEGCPVCKRSYYVFYW